MPVCTTCTNFIPYLYTVYGSAYNLRLEQCPKCHSFADPYVEHDSLTLLLDLMLLKRGVYRHLLYNRGTEPRKLLGKVQPNTLGGTSRGRWLLVLRLGAALIVLDAYLHQPADLSPWTKEALDLVLRVLLGCFAETIAFHCGIIVACYIMLMFVERVRAFLNDDAPTSDIRREFRFSLIPLSLFYSSLTKLFFLFLLTIWRPSSESIAPATSFNLSNTKFFSNTYLLDGFEMLDDDKLDREWAIRNVLGGMSAGFGLRVILDIHPLFTSLIILAGWKAKTIVAELVSRWVGGDELTGEAWRAYSIP
ncbi:Arv1-domain-containing protein [Tricholoma matsutake]|nr:Arv1-domain-containing protein [Tricholoma matsutake 945]